MKAMLLLCALIVGSGSAWAATLTLNFDSTTGWTIDKSGTSGTGSEVIMSKDGITIVASKGYYDSGNHLRVYSGSSFVVTSYIGNMSSIALTYIGGKSGPISNYTNGTATISPESSSLSESASGQARIAQMVVTYTPASTDPAITVSESSLSFGEVVATGSREMTFTVTPSNLTAGLTLSTNNDKYTVSPTSIASNATGAQTITVTANPTSVNDNMDGKVIISGDDFDNDTKVSLSTTVIRKSAGLSFSPTSVELTKGQEFTAPTFTKDASINASKINFTTTYAGVAKVSDEGVISLGGNTGTAIICASFDQTDVYEEGVATCTITVNPAGVTPEPNASGYYEKVTDTEDLEDGQYLIVYETESKALTDAVDKSNNYTKVTIADSKITSSATVDALAFTFNKTTGSFKGANGKWIGKSSSTNNGMDCNDSETSNTVSIDDNGDAQIVGTGGNRLRFNNSDDWFRYYKPSTYTAQKAIQLYKYVAGENPDNIDIYVSEAGLATYASNFDLDYSTNANLKAYIAVEDESEIKYVEVEKVPAGTGVLLRALDTAGKNYTVSTTTEETDDMTGNKFVRGNNDAVASGTGPYNYILNVVNNQIGFYRAAEKTVAKNRAYLSTSIGAASARIDIFFDDDTNGIKKIENAASNKENGTFFNLAGQRVAQPSKGLYIVNGRKVIVK